MTPEVISTYIVILLAVLGYAIVVGKVKQQVDQHDKDIGENKEENGKLRDHFDESLKETAKEFNNILREHVSMEVLRDGKVEAVKEELQKQIRESVRHEAELRYTKDQTEELKKDFLGMRVEMDNIKETTTDIKQDVIKLSTVLEELVRVSVKTQDTVQKILEASLKDKK
jgi:hypothetical protein